MSFFNKIQEAKDKLLSQQTQNLLQSGAEKALNIGKGAVISAQKQIKELEKQGRRGK